MVAKCIKLLERYVSGEETWTDRVEQHKDNGKSHMLWRPYVSAARLNMFDPENPFIQPLKNNLATALEIASKYNFSINNIWEQGTDDIELPPARSITGRYAESWRDRNARMNDMILRILRILIK